MAIEIRKGSNGTFYRAVIRINTRKVHGPWELRKIDAQNWEVEKTGARNRGELTLLDFKIDETDEHPPVEARNMSLNQLRERFLSDHAKQNQAQSTIIVESELYDKYVKPYLGDDLIVNLRDTDFTKLFKLLLTKHTLSNERINRTRGVLHSMFNRAIPWKLVKLNPVTATPRLKEKVYQKEGVFQYITQDEAMRLLDFAKINDTWLYPKLRTLLNTGLRCGEMMGLRVQDLVRSPLGAQLLVSRSYCKHMKEVRESTKGGSSRSIPLGRGMAEYLLSMVEEKRFDAPLLWEDWNEMRHRTKLYKHYLKALDAVDVRRVSIHALRHSFAVHFLERGGEIYDLQHIMGHHSIRLTERYTHFSKKMSERSRGLVDHHSDNEKTVPKLTVVDWRTRTELSPKMSPNEVFENSGQKNRVSRSS